MFKKALFLCSILFCLWCWLLPANASTFPPGEKPINVKAALRVDDIIKISERDEILNFEGEVRMQWKDPRLAFSPSEVGSSVKMFTNQAATDVLSKIWNPEVHFPDSRGKIIIGSRYLIIKSDGTVVYRKRVNVTIGIQLDLRDFPLDKQEVVFRLASFPYTADQVTLSIDHDFSKSKYAHLTDRWKIASHFVRIKNKSAYEMVFHLVRRPHYYVYQVFIPLILIVLMSLTVFWMADQPLVNRSALILACILAAMVFQWRVFSVTPNVSYQLLVDQLILWSLLVIGIALLVSLFAHHRSKESCDRIMKVCRVLFPIVYIVVFLFFIVMHYLF